MNFQWATFTLLILGWSGHWFMSWGVAYKLNKKSLLDFIDDDPPTFWFSVVSTVAAYLIGPELLKILGVELPDGIDKDGIAKVAAFVGGYTADSLVAKIAGLVKK